MEPHKFDRTEEEGPGGRWTAYCTCGKKYRGPDESHVVTWFKKHMRTRNAELGLEPCPKPDKPQYPSEDSALKGLANGQRAFGAEFTPNRVYRCECGFWHLTGKRKLPKA